MTNEDKGSARVDAVAFLLIMLVATSGLYFYEHLQIEEEKEDIEDEYNAMLVDDLSQTLLRTTINSVEYTDTDGNTHTLHDMSVQSLVATDLSLKLENPDRRDGPDLDEMEETIEYMMDMLAPEDMAIELKAGVGEDEHITLNDEANDTDQLIGTWESDLLLPDSSRTGFLTIEVYTE